MIKHLTTGERIAFRRERFCKNDLPFILFYDALRKYKKKELCTLEAEEIYQTALELCDVLKEQPSGSEEFGYTLEDLESEASCENDVMLISLVIMAILTRRSIAPNARKYKKECMAIVERWQDSKLYTDFLKLGCKKEDERLMSGLRIDLLKQDFEEARQSGEADLKSHLDWLLEVAEDMDGQTLGGLLRWMSLENIKFDNAYNDYIIALNEIYNKVISKVHVDEFVAVKNVENQIDKVESGGTGVSKVYNK